MAAQFQPPMYEKFDCRSGGENVRWTKWLRSLESGVFAGCNITAPEQKKGLLLYYAGDDLWDIIDCFDESILEPTEAVPATRNTPPSLPRTVMCA